MTSFFILISLAFFLVLLSGFCSAAETGVTSLDKILLNKQAEEGNRKAQLIRRLSQRMELVLGATLVGTNLALTASATLAHDIMGKAFPTDWIDPMNTLIMTPLLMILGDLIPKSIARNKPTEFTVRIAYPLLWLQTIFMPVIHLTGKIAAGIAAKFGTSDPSKISVTRDDVCAIAEMAAEEGVIHGETGIMLKTVFELNNKPVSAAMIPFADAKILQAESSLQQLESLAVQTGFTRFPVYGQHFHDICGIVDLRKIIFSTPEETNAECISIQPFIEANTLFVPKTKPVGELLHEMRFQHVPMAVIIDEHGSICGIVTTEDLIEEIVGEIRDERDKTPNHIKRLNKHEYECDGKTEIRHLEEVLGTQISDDDFDTAAGLVLKLLGKLPLPGEKVKYQNYEIEIIQVRKRHIKKLRIRKTQ